MKKKKILIHSIAFSPDGVSTAYLYNDLALGFILNGFDVVVLSTTPHYNVVQEELDKQPLQKCMGGLFYKSSYNGIPVYHIPQKKFKRSIFRVLGFIYWHFLTLILGLAQSNISLVLSPSPPLTIGLISIIIARLKKAKVIYNVQEIYPDFLINHGKLKSELLIRMLRNLEKFVYNHSDAVTIIDSVFYQTIVHRFKNPKKLYIIPNFVDTNIYQPIPNLEVQLQKVNFPNTPVFKVMYAGNIGYAQDWVPLVRVAKAIKRFPIEFWVIGEGVAKSALKRELDKQGLTNVHLVPYHQREQMPAIICYADLHFIFMNPDMEGQGFPSKIYTIMACKKPLLVVSGVNTPLYYFLHDKNCAFLVTNPNMEEKCREIEAVICEANENRNLLTELGVHGFELVEKKYSKKAIVMEYVYLINKLLA